MQEIWRCGCGWDEKSSWPKGGSRGSKRCRTSTKLRFLAVTELAKPTNNVELHIFCDASENGMAAVIYSRFEEEGKVECAMIGSKTRVAPLKFLTIPRLELQAAVNEARLADCIIKSHRMKIARRVFWTDSRDVIRWVRSDHQRYSQFVAFRVSELLDTTQVDEWR
ncbi:uncharacterized protein LOC131693563 [Topomyia yanbarensis]|uniref:uncharacterized protein LOC131693563 n=1 Tax=Topomyia yanbarensis TaxID=2498891 RepID=UPI00273A9262|nr:uncharacterized protein LOC131693563 [Topomyia yanbarensis]